MFFDARISIGMLFALLGTILTAFGVATRNNAAVYTKSLGINANFWWGLALLAFGTTVLLVGRRSQLRTEKNAGLGTGNGSMRLTETRKH